MDSSPPEPSSQPSGYPRRRVSVACQTCRFRKTKCNGDKPKCSFCAALNIDCIYKKITPNPRARIPRSPHTRKVKGPATAEDDFVAKESFESNLIRVNPRHNVINTPSSSAPSPPMRDGSSYYIGSANLLSRPALQGPPERYEVPVSYDVPKIHQIHLPELKNVRCVAPLNELVYDDMEAYLQREIKQGDEFFAFVPTKEVDLSPRACWLLHQSFANNILPWLPLFQADHCVRHLENATLQNYDPTNPSSTLTLFILAVGSLFGTPNDTEDAVDRLPGMEYYYRGLKGLEIYNRTKNFDIVIIQCRILSSIYLCTCLRPLQAWAAISEASNAVMVLLKMKETLEKDGNLLNAVQRAYWCCYIIEAELLNLVSFKTEGLLELHNDVALPFKDPSEPGSFYFISEISMRKLFAELLETISYQSGQNNHRPVVANVHQQQLSAWYESLAPGLKFPLGPIPVLDPHKAFLKGQYYCILVIANWSFVVRLITNEPMDSERRAYITKHGKECMESIYLYVYAVEKMMMCRQALLFANFYGLYCLVIQLLVTYKVPELHDIQIAGVDIAITRGYLAIKTWEKNPSIGVCARRIEEMMLRLGIPLQEPSPYFARSETRLG